MVSLIQLGLEGLSSGRGYIKLSTSLNGGLHLKLGMESSAGFGKTARFIMSRLKSFTVTFIL